MLTPTLVGDDGDDAATLVQTPLMSFLADTEDPLHFNPLASSSDPNVSLIFVPSSWIELNFSISARHFMSRWPTAELLPPVSAFKGSSPSPASFSVPPVPPSPKVTPSPLVPPTSWKLPPLACFCFNGNFNGKMAKNHFLAIKSSVLQPSSYHC